MFLRILVPNMSVSMETCSAGKEEVCSRTIQERNVLELFKNSTCLNFPRTVKFKNRTFLNLFKNSF